MPDLTTLGNPRFPGVRIRRSAHVALAALAALAWATTFASAAPMFQGEFLAFDVDGWPFASATADFDGDGHTDVATANLDSNTVTVYRGAGDGTLRDRRDIPTGLEPRGLATTDVNGDGHMDIVVAAYGATVLSVHHGSGDGSFAPRIDVVMSCRPWGVAVADLDHDGRADLLGLSHCNTLLVRRQLANGTFGPEAVVIAGDWARAMAVADLNQDTHADVVTANWNSNSASVLLGVGDGTFQPKVEYPAGQQPQSVAVADLDRDGVYDLMVGGFGVPALAVLRGLGAGQFAPHGTYGQVFEVAGMVAADFDGDGDTDLLSRPGASLWPGNGDGTLQAPIQLPGPDGGAISLADLNEDGRPDAITASQSARCCSVMLGNGDGTFGTGRSFHVGFQPSSLVLADVNLDSRLDLVSGGHSDSVEPVGAVLVCLGDGAGGFGAPLATWTFDPPRAVAVGDFDADGIPDVAACIQATNQIRILRGVGGGTFTFGFTAGVGASPTAVVSADLDADGDLDLAVANYGAGTVSVLLGQGDGTFAAAPTIALPSTPYAITAGDLDGDGLPELATVNLYAHEGCLIRNLGAGAFGPSVTFFPDQAPADLEVADVDGDGDNDIITANVWWGTISLLRGDGTGALLPRFDIPAGIGACGIELLHLDGDPWMDAVVSNDAIDSGTLSVLHGAPDVGFGPRTGYGAGFAPFQVAAGDLNGDGAPDLVALNLSQGNVTVLLNQTAVVHVPGPGPVALALGSCYPNPSAGTVVIPFALPAPGRARLRVYDLAGRLLETVLDAERPAGRSLAHWTPAARHGAGLYFVELWAFDQHRSARLVVVR